MPVFKRICVLVCFLWAHIALAQTASFTYTMTPSNGCAPVNVCFHSTSTGTITTYAWNLGNSTPVSPSNPDPCTIYTKAGSYTVTLQVAGPGGTSTPVTQTIVVHDTPSVNFVGAPITGCPPLTVSFNNTGTNPNAPPPTTYTWYTTGGNPGGPTINPTTSSTYNSGNYTVSLTVTNSWGCTRSHTKTNFVNVYTKPTGNFNASQTIFCATPTGNVTFNGSATGGTPPYTYTWDYGDGPPLGSGQSTTHTYTGPKGTCYTVRMIVTDNNGCKDTVTKPSYICIPNLQANFTASLTSACVGTEITFTNTSTPASSSTEWDFQYPSTFVSGPPTIGHTYYAGGTYTVAMIHHYGPCADTEYKQIIIYPQPTINYSFTPAQPCPAPQTLTFTGTGASTYTWDYGDGLPGGTGNPISHQYTTCGLYTPTLIATDNHGCKDTLTRVYDVQIYCGQLNIYPRYDKGCRPLRDTFYADISGLLYIPNFSNVPYPYPIASYEWDFGDGTPKSYAPVPVHVFDTCGVINVTLKATTTNGCVFNTSFPIYVGQKPNAGFTVNTTHVCPDDTIHFTNTSTYPCYKGGIITNIWDFGDNSGSGDTNPVHAYGDTAGSFCVTLVTDYNGCPDTFKACPTTKILVDSPIALFDFSYNCTNRLSVSFTNKGYGFTSFYWQFPSPIGVVNTLNPVVTFPGYGSYDVKLFTFNSNTGCMDTIRKTVTLMNPSIVLTATDTTVCRITDVRFNAVFVNPSYGTNTYWWYVNDLFQTKDSAVNYTYHFINTGYYKIMVRMLDGMGCWDTLTKPNWVLVSKPNVNFTGNPPSGCVPLTVSFTDNSVQVPAAAGPLPGAPLVNRYWEFGPIGATASVPGPTISYTYQADGNYDVKLVVTDASGCKDSMTKLGYIQAHKPHADFAADDPTSCIGTPVNFINNSTGGASYKWEFGDGDTSLAASPAHAYKAVGSYTVRLIVTDNYGCKDTMTKTGFVSLTRPHAAFTMSDSIAICPPLNVTFTNYSTSYTNMKWVFGTGNISNTGVVSSVAELYNTPEYDTVYVIAIDGEGCMDTAIGHVNILGYAGAFDYAPLIGCKPFEVTFNTTLQNIPTIIWDFGDGNTVTSSTTSGGGSVKHIYTTAGAYVPKIILSNGSGCSSSSIGIDTIKIDEATAKFTHSPACKGYFVKFKDTSSGYFSHITTWAWSFDGGPVTSTLNQTSRYYANPGTYPLTLVVTNANGCRDTLDTTIVIHELPVISAGADTVICLSDAANLHATGGISYAWAPPTTLSCTDCPNPNANPIVKTEYTVIGTDINGCSDTDRVIVNLKFKVTALVDSGGEICNDESIVLKASGAKAYEWTPADVLDNNKVPAPVASPHNNTKFRVVSFEGSCIPDTDYVDVIVHPKPTVHASGGTTIIAGGDAPLQAEGTDIHKFLWKPAETLNCTDCPNPIAKPIRTTTYVIVATTEFNCQDSDKVTVKVLCDQSQLFIPNTFTPNGDGQNDVFYPRGVGFDRLRAFRVYDRWGELLYERTAFPLNDRASGWDGTYKGKVLPPDVYVYAVEADCEDGEVIRWKGDVTLIR